MDLYKPNDLRNSNILWFSLGQFAYYQSEKHMQLAEAYNRIFRHIIRVKGAPNV